MRERRGRARVVDGHDVFPAAEGTKCEAAAEPFPEGGQIGGEAKDGL